jgi:hypothetical protein
MNEHTSESLNSPWTPYRRPVSVLAVAESIVISAATLLTSFLWDMPLFMLAVAFAPLFLLRTNDSVVRGFRLLGLVATPLQLIWRFIAWPILRFDGIHSTGQRGPMLSRIIFCPIGIPYAVLAYVTMFSLVVVTMLFIRVFATALEFLRSLPASLNVIPANYVTFLAVTRVFDEPVLLPGVGYANLREYDIDDRIVDFLRPGPRIRRAMQDFDTGLIAIALPIYLIMIVTPAVLGRASVKASLPFYGHLSWTLYTTITLPLTSIIESMVRGPFANLWKFFSSMSICFVVLKLIALAMLNPQLQKINRFLEGSVALHLIEPLELPWWQIASGVAGILFFVAFGTCRVLETYPQLQSKSTIAAFLRSLLVVRASLALYSTFCTGYILLASLPTLEWPRIGSKLFPW